MIISRNYFLTTDLWPLTFDQWPLSSTQKNPIFVLKTGQSKLLAEREGFEPPDPWRSTVFKTAAFDHSAIFPNAKIRFFLKIGKTKIKLLSQKTITKHFTTEKNPKKCDFSDKKLTFFTIRITFSTKNSLSLYAKASFSLAQST